MIELKIDEKVVEERLHEELKKRLDHLQNKLTFWDMKELCRQTCMSENFIKDQFFYEEDFPKYRVGKKWLFPAKETEHFLIQWLKKRKGV